jgi:DNA-directed RNA polymerase specialized sigma24 family protein
MQPIQVLRQMSEHSEGTRAGRRPRKFCDAAGRRRTPVRAALTAEKFEGLLQRLDCDRDRAGARYEEIRRKLIRFFLWRYCRDAESLVDETLDRVAGKLAEDRATIRNITAFVWGVARNVRQEAVRRDARTVPLPDFSLDDGLFAGAWTPADPPGHAGDQERIRCLRKCIQSLSEGDRRLLVTYHLTGGRRADERRRLAQEIGITQGALRIRATRLRFKLAELMSRSLAA